MTLREERLVTLPMAGPARQPRSRRHCTYCPEPDADACVRARSDEEGGDHVYAHQACAADRKVPTLYVFTDEQPAGAPR